ncbi:hypothetical protein EDD86DRAFT_249235 [Gorgonomyces haynaldii]|nr:hypothetical protein EDD86DRAFT_249235 [Gorgonomyces haynaldii]
MVFFSSYPSFATVYVNVNDLYPLFVEDEPCVRQAYRKSCYPGKRARCHPFIDPGFWEPVKQKGKQVDEALYQSQQPRKTVIPVRTEDEEPLLVPMDEYLAKHQAHEPEQENEEEIQVPLVKPLSQDTESGLPSYKAAIVTESEPPSYKAAVVTEEAEHQESSGFKPDEVEQESSGLKQDDTQDWDLIKNGFNAVVEAFETKHIVTIVCPEFVEKQSLKADLVDGHLQVLEQTTGFEYRLRLPREVSPSRISASFEDHTLVLVLGHQTKLPVTIQ